jgi:p-cumate 2,3-dioxygenase alpha subunit
MHIRRLVHEDRESGLFRVHRQAFLDEDVFAEEQRRIFERCWLYVGHESEVADNGDYRLRDLGTRRVIFVRGSDGAVRAFLNSCTHRGAEVCRQRTGNAKSFQCFYHGWTFRNDGSLVGVPGEEAYPSGFDRAELGLRPVPRLDAYRGFWFVSFDPNVMSLHDYLAGAREYLDLVADQSETGMEIVGGTQSYAIHSNWKLLAENSYDGYHAQIAHTRYMKYLMSTGAVGAIDGGPQSRAVDLGNGHAVLEYSAPWGRPIARWTPAFGEETRPEIDALRAGIEKRLGRERAQRVCSTSRNLGIFPNLVVNDIMAITVRTFHPLAPGRMNVDAWSLAPVDEKPSHRKIRLENFLTFLGPGGFATPDDIEALESCQRGYRSTPDAWNDISRDSQVSRPTITGEHQMRAFWRRWVELLAPEGSAALREVRDVAAG